MDTYATLIGAAMLVVGGIAAALRVFLRRPERAEPVPRPADPEAEARAVDAAEKAIEETAAEVERIDASDSADRTRGAGSRLRR